MKIAHVVTYVSEDGAFGGPIAVARTQVEELARRGHEVHLLAGWDGRARLTIDGVRVGLFRTRRIAPGFSGLVAPALLRHLRKAASEYDIVHVHLGRDLVTLPVAHVAVSSGARLILQTHGMVMPDDRLLARIVDAALTRRVLSGAFSVLALTEREEKGLAEVVRGSSVNVERIANGIGHSGEERTSANEPPIVLFLARLHPRKRVIDFAQAAVLAHENGVRARFRVIGPDEGDLARLAPFLTSAGGPVEYCGTVASGAGVGELAKADVYVLPSRGEVFPMTVLEALSVGTPVILGSDCAIGQELRNRGAVTLVDDGPDHLAAAIATLLADPVRRARQAAAGLDAIDDWLSIEAVTDRLESVYA